MDPLPSQREPIERGAANLNVTLAIARIAIEITAPAAGATVPRGAVVVVWKPVAEGRGIDIVGYRAIVEREDPLRVYTVDLAASATSVTVPAQYLESGVDYKAEVPGDRGERQPDAHRA